VDKLNKETGECVQVVENLAMAFESSKYVYTEKPYERYDLWSVRGRDKVYKRIQDMIGEAKVNVFFTSTANGLVRIYKAHSEVLEKAAERGAKVKVAAPINQTNASVARELGEVKKRRDANNALRQRRLCGNNLHRRHPRRHQRKRGTRRRYLDQ
jgi:sugar-specific transcriptional regulator TrmB